MYCFGVERNVHNEKNDFINDKNYLFVIFSVEF